MNDLVKTFDYSGHSIRTVTIDDQPWFVGGDVARVLGYSATSAMLRRLDDDDKGVRELHTPGGQQSLSIISESGMYAAILSSQVDGAKTFKRWLTHDVLPAIRKTGSYGIDQRNVAELTTRADLARMVLESEEEKAILAAALESATPAIEYHDRFVANDDAITVGAWAAQYGMTDPQARKLLLEKNIIYRFAIGERWSAKAGAVVKEYEYRARAGRVSFAWFDLRPQHNVRRHHNGQVRQTLYVRQQYSLDLGRKLGLAPLPVQTEIETQA